MIKIVHIGSVKYQENRKEEYDDVFNKLFNSLKEIKPTHILILEKISDELINQLRLLCNNVIISEDNATSVIETDNIIWHMNPKEKILLNKNKQNFCIINESTDKSLFQNYVACFGKSNKTFQYSPNTVFAGCLIQQSIDVGHNDNGFILWEITNEIKIKKIIINNTIGGYMKICINKEGIIISKKPFLKNPIYWDIIHHKLTSENIINLFLSKYTEIFKKKPRQIIQEDKVVQQLVLQKEEEVKEEVSHENIIRNLLKDYQYLDNIIELHKSLYKENIIQNKNSKIRLLTLKFGNMYSFGNENIVDFTKLENGITGMMSSNHSGKSSFIETILFALYGYRSRAFQRNEILHSGLQNAYTDLDYEINGVRHNIKRTLKGIHATETVSTDEENIGNVDTALLTSFQLQDDINEFINSKPSQRKQILSNILNIGYFTDIEKIVTKEIITLNGEIRVLTRQISNEDELTSQKLKVSESILQIEREITDLSKQEEIKRKELMKASINLGAKLQEKSSKDILTQLLNQSKEIEKEVINLSECKQIKYVLLINQKLLHERIKQQMENSLSLSTDFLFKQQNQSILKTYKTLLKPDGIASVLLQKFRLTFQNSINTILSELKTNYIIEINDEFEILHLSHTGNWLSINLSSGYQKFILNLAIRLTLLEFSYHPCIDGMFFDESFNSCDDINLINIMSNIQNLSIKPKLFFIISHSKKIKPFINNTLDIVITDNCSMISNVDIKFEKQELPIEYSDDKKTFTCLICDKTLSINCLNRHLNSKLHNK